MSVGGDGGKMFGLGRAPGFLRFARFLARPGGAHRDAALSSIVAGLFGGGRRGVGYRAPYNHTIAQRWRGRRGANRHTTCTNQTQGRECARRLRQVREGHLAGRCGPRLRSDFVTTEARYAAVGLVAGTMRR